MISVRVLRLFHNKVYLYCLHKLGSSDLCEGLMSIPEQGLFPPFASVGSGDPVRVLRLFHNKVYLYCLDKLGSSDLCEGLTSISQQGLFVPFAYVRI